VGKAIVLLGQTSAEGFVRSWHAYEVMHWVEAARERDFNLRFLDDPVLRADCYAELNRQLDDETRSLPREPNHE
jgi:hypothetical protein